MSKFFYNFLIGSLITISVFAEEHYDIVVAQDGSGDFTTITEAINKLGMYNYQRVVMFIKKGVYNEKIRIEQDNITFIGEDRDSTIIQFYQLREDWKNDKDYIGPAVINIHADDLVFKNLTIINTQPQIGPHAFTIFGTGTRIILDNCSVISKGGDTVSLWNYKNGMFYHNNCHFEGAVDFVCPRGWCYISNSTFYEVKKTAAIWHAAPLNKDQKLVIVNSVFDGVKGFQLGRHHYEAQFYLINCKYSENMADTPIYRVRYPKAPHHERPYFWGDRKFFYNSEKEVEQFEWLATNLTEIKPGKITPEWTFDGQWNPVSTNPPELRSFEIINNEVNLHFNELLTIRGDVIIKTRGGQELKFVMGKGRDIVKFVAENNISEDDIKQGVSIVKGALVANEATVDERRLDIESGWIVPNCK